ncbi:MAG TPA: MFS transporter [Methylomirabilota bacterium]|nr:MFS transporter [Methylomirabilota bacterium]
MSAPIDTQKAGRREWMGLAVLVLPCLLVAMDLTVLNLAVPSLSAALAPSASQLLWIVDIYGFLIAGSLITMGTLGDRIGRRRLLLMGATAFGAASVLAAFATSAGTLIAARAVLGVAGATLMPSTLSLIRNMFHDPRQRTAAIGIWTTSFSIGGILGPLLGGMLLAHFWWGSVFLLAVPAMALLLVLGPMLLPEFREEQPGHFDIPSAALSLFAILAVIFGVKRIAEYGLGHTPLASIGVGVLLGAAFIRRQRQPEDPLIDLGLFERAAFSASLGINTLAFFVMYGVFFFMAQFLQLVLGLSPLAAGLWTVPSSAAFIVGSLLTPVVLRHVRPWLMMAGGLIICAVGLSVLTWVDGEYGLPPIVIGSIVVLLGLAPVYILATDMIVASAPPERAGAASAMSETSAELGGALGIAILGSIGAAVYRGMMAEALPAGIPAEKAETARATLGGALSAAASVGGPLGVELMARAREAFAQGLEMTAVIGAAVVLAAAVTAVMTLRRVAWQGGSS